MSREIKPVWKNGEPMCTADCPCYGLYSFTVVVGREPLESGCRWCTAGNACVPGLQQQRDEAVTKERYTRALLKDERRHRAAAMKTLKNVAKQRDQAHEELHQLHQKQASNPFILDKLATLKASDVVRGGLKRGAVLEIPCGRGNWLEWLIRESLEEEYARIKETGK